MNKLNTINVHQLRALAPDKAALWTHSDIRLIKRDLTNLVDFTLEELIDLRKSKSYILPADEGDIRHANLMKSKGLGNDDFIILPQTKLGSDISIIDFNYFVPKNSSIYEDLDINTGVTYPTFTTVSTKSFDDIYGYLAGSPELELAIKSTTGSGSRGVILISKDPERLRLGGKWSKSLEREQIEDLLEYCDREECDLILQDLIPLEDSRGVRLLKCNVDFIIKEGKLLGYKWDEVNQDQQFTNWDNGYFIRNEYTDDVMDRISDYLVSRGIYNALMNFEAYSNLDGETWMVEFNWRYSNSMFEGQALGLDMIHAYINSIPFQIPIGRYKFYRYWQCKLADNLVRKKIWVLNEKTDTIFIRTEMNFISNGVTKLGKAVQCTIKELDKILVSKGMDINKYNVSLFIPL